jgi:DNA-directed RNA polymerase subunit RPC12/RpoP
VDIISRKKKVLDLDKLENQSVTYKCISCGKEFDGAVGKFYKISYSKRWKANDGYAPFCRECVNNLFDEMSRRYKSDKTAFIIICAMLDIPFYHSLFDSIVLNNNVFSPGLYLRMMNNRQYQMKDFSTTLLSDELNKTDEKIQDERESKWSTSECRNKNEVIKLLGYDPFEGYDSDDRRYLFSELIKYMDEDVTDDPYKLSQIIQIVNNNNQIRKDDLTISTLDPTKNASDIKVLNEIKAKLVLSNDKIAKENEISVKNRSNKDIGKGTLTFLMRDLREKGFKEAESNFYDQLSSKATQWAADMSLKAIKENSFFDENDGKEIFETQRQLISQLQHDSDDAKEKNRLLLIENEKIRSLLDANKIKFIEDDES